MIEMGTDRHNEIKVYVNGVNAINFLDPYNHRCMKYHFYDNIKDKIANWYIELWTLLRNMVS